MEKIRPKSEKTQNTHLYAKKDHKTGKIHICFLNVELLLI